MQSGHINRVRLYFPSLSVRRWFLRSTSGIITTHFPDILKVLNLTQKLNTYIFEYAYNHGRIQGGGGGQGKPPPQNFNRWKEKKIGRKEKKKSKKKEENKQQC